MVAQDRGQETILSNRNRPSLNTGERHYLEQKERNQTQFKRYCESEQRGERGGAVFFVSYFLYKKTAPTANERQATRRDT